jgi:DDE_Tnp_1-associated
MLPSASESLLAAMQRLTDPRKRRGLRHPFAALLSLTLLGLLCRQSDFLSIARWADDHGDRLRHALGFTRRHAPPTPPCPAPALASAWTNSATP